MADYDLTRLGASEFEQLIQALAVRVFGPRVRVYGQGRDGGRDATIDGRVQVPGTEGEWNGYTVVQVKFRSRPATPAANAAWLAGEVRDEFEGWVSRARAATRLPDNLLVASNVVLSAVPDGGVDRMEALMSAFSAHLPLRGVHVWHHDQICRLLDDAADVRAAYAGLLTPGDVIEDLRRRAGAVPVGPRARVNMAPGPPANFVVREHEGTALLSALTDAEEAETVGLLSAAAVHGTGGYGKTSLAAWACHQAAVIEAFPEGILWVELGRDPADDRVVSTLSDLVGLLTGTTPQTFSTIPAAAAAFAAATKGRRALVVVDDVWRSQDLAPFLGGDPECRRLATTRKPGALPAGGARIDVGLMSPAQAMALLTAGLGDDASETVFGLYERSGRWPLALGLLNGVLRSMLIRFSQPLEELVGIVTGRLDAAGAVAIDTVAGEGQPSIAGTLELSLVELDETAGAEASERLITLATFPEGMELGYELLGLLWGADAVETRRSCELLADRSLLGSVSASGVRLHDEIRDFLRRSRWPSVEQAHRAVLDAVGTRCDEGWHELGVTVPAAADALAYHLVNSGRENELRDALSDLRYHAARLRTAGPAALAGDVHICATAFARDPYLSDLGRCIALEGHLVLELESERDIAATWHSRLVGHPVLAAAIPQSTLLAGALIAARAFPDLPDPRLHQVLHGHTNAVQALCWRRDGRRLASVSGDGTVRIWDPVSGRQLDVVRTGGEGSGATTVAWSSNGLYLAVGTERCVALVDAVEGHLLASASMPGEVHCLSFSPDTDYVLVAASDRLMTLLLENLRVGADEELPSRCFAWIGDDLVLGSGLAGELRRLRVTRDHLRVIGTRRTALTSVRDIELRPQRDVAIVVGAGSHLLLVDPHQLEILAESAEKEVGSNACSWSDNGATLAVGTADGHVDIWGDPATSAVHFLPEGQRREEWERRLGAVTVLDYRGVFVNDVAWRPGGSELAVAASSPVIRIWDRLTHDPSGGDDVGIYDLACQADGDLVACGTVEGELQIASMSEGSRWTRPGHEQRVRSVSWSPDDTRVLTHGEDRRLMLWRAAPEPEAVAELRHDAEWPGPLAWFPSSGRAAVAIGSTVAIIDARGDRLRIEREVDIAMHISALCFAADGARLIVGTADVDLLELDLGTYSLARHAGHSDAIAAVRVDDAERIVSCSHKGEVLRWEPSSWRPTRLGQLATDSVWDLELTDDGRTMVAAANSGIALCADVEAPERAARLKVDSGLTSCSLSGDGRVAVFGGSAGLYTCRLGVGGGG